MKIRIIGYLQIIADSIHFPAITLHFIKTHPITVGRVAQSV